MSDITVIYGTDVVEMTYRLLRDADVESQIGSGMRVVIKPNLVVARPASEGATTHPEIVEGIVLFLKDCGVTSPTVAEGAWLGEATDRAFERCGYKNLAKKYGLKLFDTKKDDVARINACGLTLGVCKTVADADFLINVPVLKGHCQTALTCCLKNMKGCIPDAEKRRYHNIGLHKPIAALNTILKPNLHVIDGICGDPTFEEGGNPVVSNRILLGTDPVLLDSYAATLLGLEPTNIGYLRYAAEYGIGTLLDETTTICEQRTKNRQQASPAGQSDLVRRLAGHIDEQNACSACFAALVCALHQTGTRHLKDKIKIGQGFRGQTCSGFGVGNCTAGCKHSVPGCPPTATEIVRHLAEP